VACGWNFSRIEPVSVSSPAPSTIRRGGDGIQVHGATAHLDKLKSTHSSKQIHTLSPAVLPMGRTAAMLAPGALAGDVHSDRFPVNSDCVDHSRAPPARV
jgi:hypothetical protein